MMDWVRWTGQFLEDGMTGKPSMKRAALLVGVGSLSTALLVLALAAYNGHSVGVEITAVATTLGTVISYAYVNGKKVEADKAEASQNAAN